MSSGNGGWRGRPEYAISHDMTLPGVPPFELEFSKFFVQGRDLVVLFTFKRGQFKVEKIFGVKITEESKGKYSCEVNFPRIKGFIGWDCRIGQRDAPKYMPLVEQIFRFRAQEYIDDLLKSQQ